MNFIIHCEIINANALYIVEEKKEKERRKKRKNVRKNSGLLGSTIRKRRSKRKKNC